MKKLTKSNNRKLFGVCGGVAEYFDVDPTIVRIVWVILAFFWGAGIAIYIIAGLIMPDKEYKFTEDDISSMKSANVNDYAENARAKKEAESKAKGHSEEEFNSYFDKEK